MRLFGIDTPESRLNQKARKDAEKSNEDIKNIIKAGREAICFLQILAKTRDEVRL